MSSKISQKPSAEASPKTLRCYFCGHSIPASAQDICERVILHMESVPPREALPFAESDAIVLDALERGLSVLPWEDE